jgi:hypothetical protein
MGVSSDNKGSQIAVELDRSVDAATLNPAIIFDQDDPYVTQRALLHDFHRVIGAASINNDNLMYDSGWLRSKVGNCSFDVIFFI